MAQVPSRRCGAFTARRIQAAQHRRTPGFRQRGLLYHRAVNSAFLARIDVSLGCYGSCH
jgi:hypothetical protein